MTQLSANFSLHEMCKSETAMRMGLDNTPDDAATESLRLLCEKVLQPVRDHYGKGEGELCLPLSRVECGGGRQQDQRPLQRNGG